MALNIKDNLLRKIPNLITFLRVILIFCAILFLSNNNLNISRLGIAFLLLALLFDGLDGILARKFNVDGNIGALIDTLGDRITENTFLVFLVYKNIIPLFVPLVFITRSFMADFIRCLTFQKGFSTFMLNKSWLGQHIVASKISRITYLLLKFALFILGSFIIVYPNAGFRSSLTALLFYLAIIVTFICILRFAVLTLDCRKILKEIIRDA